MPAGNTRPRIVWLQYGMAAVALAILGFPGITIAQEVDARKLALGKRIWSEKGQCQTCHGWAADGTPAGQAPPGPSLRITQLNREQVAEVIRCGRPSTEMPAHDRMAYVDDRCYGVTEADLGADRPVQAANTLLPREVDAVVEYIFATYVGKPAPTLSDCEAYFGPESNACRNYH